MTDTPLNRLRRLAEILGDTYPGPDLIDLIAYHERDQKKIKKLERLLRHQHAGRQGVKQ